MNPHPASRITTTGRPAGRWLAACLWLAGLGLVAGGEAPDLFQRGVRAYENGQFAAAARAFREAGTNRPSSGSFFNLGLSEWRRGRAGAAICAWEQTLWITPQHASARNSLAYARRVLDLESPRLRWYERVSMWLPANAWMWISGVGLWLVVAAVLGPDIFGRRRTGFSQALAAGGLMILLLGIPAQIGVSTRQRIGFILQRNTQLRLTPTSEGEVISRLAAGEPARLRRVRGGYVLVKTLQGEGWLEQNQFGLIVPR